MDMYIGINRQNREIIAADLARLLADSYTLYLKTQSFHWNVKGPMFQQLHALFQTQYTELALAIDEIAERIRALGHRAPGSYSEFAKLTSVPETDGAPPAADMLHALLKGHEALIVTARTALRGAGEAGDEASVDIAVQRIQAHEKAAWMLRSQMEV